MTQLNKVKGAKATCPSCKAEIFCNEKPASGNFPAKLQWQNADHTAHYGFNFETKEVTCGKKEVTLGISMPKGDELEQKVMDRISNDCEAIAKLKIAKYIGVKKACMDSGIDNPAMIGMIFNAVDKEEID